LATDDAGRDKGIIHYEGGLPIIDAQLDQIRREQREAKERDDEYKRDQLKLNRRMTWFLAA
jgi:hypothetical protein